MAVQAPPSVDALPPNPSTANPTNFDTLGDAFLGAFPVLRSQLIALGANVFNNATETAAGATIAVNAKNDAQAASSAAALTAGAERWVSGKAYLEGQKAWSALDWQTYRRRSAGASATDPSQDPANWAIVGMRKTAVQAAPTLVTPAQFQAAGNVEISFAGASKLVGGSIDSFIIVWWDGSTQAVTATANAGSASKTIAATVGETKKISVIAIDNLGNESVPTTNTISIVANNPPTGTLTVSAPTQVNKNSSGNQISCSGITDADGDGVTYTITDPGILTFSKLKGITSGEIVTFSAGEVAVDTTTVVKVKAVDPKGGETAEVSTSIIVKAVVIIGVVLKTTGGNGGTWSHIDKDGNDIADPGLSAFNGMAPWSGIVDQTIDSQAMVKIPKFYYKRGTISGGANNGKEAWWIASEATTGFTIHPAFRKAGADIAQFWVGKYQGVIDTAKLASLNLGSGPTTNISQTDTISYANNRNVGGVTGFMLWSFHQWSAIQLLYLIENKTMDSQTKTAQGYMSGGGPASVNNATVMAAGYRGITGLWGNVHQRIDGLRLSAGNLQVWDLNGNKGWVSSGATFATGSSTPVYPLTFNTSANLQAAFVAITSAASVVAATAPDQQLYSPDPGGYLFGTVGSGPSTNENAGLWSHWLVYADSANASASVGRLAKE